jgi:hypothetical protein
MGSVLIVCLIFAQSLSPAARSRAAHHRLAASARVLARGHGRRAAVPKYKKPLPGVRVRRFLSFASRTYTKPVRLCLPPGSVPSVSSTRPGRIAGRAGHSPLPFFRAGRFRRWRGVGEGGVCKSLPRRGVRYTPCRRRRSPPALRNHFRKRPRVGRGCAI